MSRAAEARSRPGLLSWQTVVPVAAGLVVVALALPAALEGVRDLLGPALRQEGIDIGWLDRDWSAWWLQWRWVGLVAVALLVVVMVWSWWRTRRARRRAEQLEILTSRLAKVMPPDWDAGQQLRVRRWHGISPVRVQLRLSAQCSDSDPEWRLAITMTLRSRMGPIVPIAWPRPGDRRRRIDVRVRPPATGGDVPEDGGGGQLDPPEVEERLVKALAGLVPRPVPKARRDRDGKLVVEVGYGETTRDQSLQWRSRVAEQASARLDLKFRAVWDRHRRVFSLLPVPELPETIDWVEQARQLRKLNVGRYVAGYGTDENGATVAWEPGDGQPHAMMNGPTGSGKALDVATPIPTPSGWTTMGALRVGDAVFDETGRPTTVLAVYDQPPNRPCFEVVFSDGSTVVADADHLWWTEDQLARGSRSKAKSAETARVRRTRLPAEVTTRLRALAAAAGQQDTLTIAEAAQLAGADPTCGWLRDAAAQVTPTRAVRPGRRVFSYRQQTVEQLQTVRLYPASLAYAALHDLAEVGDRPALARHTLVLSALRVDSSADLLLTARDLAGQLGAPRGHVARWLGQSGVPGRLEQRLVRLHVPAKSVHRTAAGARAFPAAALLSEVAAAGDVVIRDQRNTATAGAVRTTIEIRDTLTGSGGRLNHSIPVCQPLDTPDACLPVAPYTLGAWLGDGWSWGPRISSADPEVIDHILGEGYQVRRYTSARDAVTPCREYHVGGLHTPLRHLGLLSTRTEPGSHKRIPAIYLRASIAQRRAVLAGLLDTDGTVAPAGSTEFTTTRPALAEDVLELALSLGYRATRREGAAYLNGRYCGRQWTIAFTTSDQVFRLSRKLATLQQRTRRHQPDRTMYRYIREVRPVPSRPVRCITVDAPSHLYLAGHSMIPTHNTVAMKSLLNSLLLSGCLVAILDIKKIDYAAYLGRPGVVCVATTTEDIVGALMDLMAEVHRRNAAGQLRRLTEQYPQLGGDIPPPAQAAIDQVPLIIFFDELAVFVDELDSWWRSLSKAERLEKWGSDASTPPAKQIPSQIVSIARAISIHLCVGTQRGDARNFGDSTNMRDNIKHMVSMGAQSAIGSEMQWGDRSIGRDVEITDDVGGIGVSNGLRISSAGDRLGRDVPGRYKAWFSDKVEQTENFWAEVAEVAADATLVNLPHVSTAARDPHAAARDLWVHAYGDPGGTWPLLPTADTPEETDDELVGPDEPGTSGSDADGISNQGDADGISDTDEASAGGISVDPDLRRAADLVVETGSGSAALLQRRLRIGSARAQRLITELEGLGVVGPAHARTKPREVLVTADELPGILDSKAGGDLPAPVTGDRDSTGRVWEQVPVVRVEIGDLVVIGDLDEAEVLEGPSDVVDDLTGGELLRLVVLADAEEQVVDLDYDEVVARARP